MIRWLSCAFLALLFLPGASWSQEKKKMNILFIAVDDLNHWVGYLGRNKQTKTPNIDKLAARGVAFTHSYCAAPVCNPSRAALMSGLRPSTTGVYGNGTDWRNLIAEELTLTTFLRRAGFYVAGAGKIYHGAYERPAEWDDYAHPKGKKVPFEQKQAGLLPYGKIKGGDDVDADYHITNHIIAQLKKKHEKPFFLACGLHKPHLPWNVPQKYYDMFPLDKIELPPHIANDLDDIPPAGQKMARLQGDHAAILKTDTWKQAIQAYLACIAYTDMNIGRLLEALDESEYRDNTMIVFWCDHGWHLGEKEHWRKFALWEEATRAPLIWVVPGLTKANSVCERTVDFMSVFPTIADLYGIPAPKHCEGKSIKALLENPRAEWKTPALTTHGYKNHAVRTEQWRYIRYADGGEELYDETKDPYEWKNLAKNAEYAKLKEELAKYMPALNKETPKEKKNKKNKKEGVDYLSDLISPLPQRSFLDPGPATLFDGPGRPYRREIRLE
jgi:arylsulfatase A-like enzyme